MFRTGSHTEETVTSVPEKINAIIRDRGGFSNPAHGRLPGMLHKPHVATWQEYKREKNRQLHREVAGRFIEPGEFTSTV